MLTQPSPQHEAQWHCAVAFVDDAAQEHLLDWLPWPARSERIPELTLDDREDGFGHPALPVLAPGEMGLHPATMRRPGWPMPPRVARMMCLTPGSSRRQR